MLMLQGVVVSTLQLPQQLRRRGGRTNSGPHRHRIDQQTHHRFGTEHLGRPTRNRGTERHITVPAQRTQQQRPRTLQHHIDRRLPRTRQLTNVFGDLLRQLERLNAAVSRPVRCGWTDKCGRIESRHRLAPRVLGRNLIAFGKPGDKAAIRGRRSQPLSTQTREDLLYEDRHRPTVEHDVMGRQYEAVLLISGADERRPNGASVCEVAHGDSFGGADLLDLSVDISAVEIQREVLPGHYGVGRDCLYRRIESLIEAGRQMGMSVDHRLDGITKLLRVELSIQHEAQLHRVHVVATPCGTGVVEQPLLQRSQREQIGEVMLPRQFIDLPLIQHGGGDIRRGQSTTATSNMRTDPGQGLKPQFVQSADLRLIKCRTRPSPVRIQQDARFGLDHDGVELQRMPQRRRHPAGGSGQRRAIRAKLPPGTGEPADPAQVVERDRRIGCRKIHRRIEVTQQTVRQPVGQCPCLFLGGLDHGTQRRIAGHHTGPGQSIQIQRYRILGSEPTHRTREIDTAGACSTQLA
ncbi:Uncharacterised protein [Mycobacteroides abscessus subsp. abscessus]|nr:Uncharacterised protein [Mycobacteroides abscessus subsp. abscessus]